MSFLDKNLILHSWQNIGITVVPGFSVLGFIALPGFRALNAGNQIWFYIIDLPGFRAPFCGDGRSTINPGTTLD